MEAVRNSSYARVERTLRGDRTTTNHTVNERARVLSGMLEQILASTDNFVDVADQTTHFLIEMLGYDSGLVLERSGSGWRPVADAGDACSVPTQVLERVEKGHMYYRAAAAGEPGAKSVLAIPVLRSDGKIAALVYGERGGVPDQPSPIDSLESALAELLALRLSATLMPRGSAHWQSGQPSTLAETQEQEVTVLFCDVRGFSKLAEQAAPQLIGGLISELFEFAGEQIHAHGGRIVDCYGDGLLAMWVVEADAPAAGDCLAVSACEAALAIHGGLPDLSSRWEVALGEPLRIGISLNTGPALVGNTGNQLRSKFGPFGHTVNLACRVEHAVKYFDLPILMTRATAAHLHDFATRRLGRVRLTGLSQTVELYQLHDRTTTPAWQQWSRTYEQALALFEAGQWEAVCQVLAPLLSPIDGRRDRACLHLLARAVDCLRFPREPSTWVFEVKDQGAW